MKPIVIIAMSLLLAACVSASRGETYAPATPVIVGVSIQEAQRMLDAATATAQAAATQSAQATAARVHEIEQLNDQMTRDASAAQIVAAQARAEATRAALTPTAFALSLTQSAVTAQAQARATQSVVAAAATARGDTLKTAAGILVICLFAVIIYYLYWLGRVHIANLMFRSLGNGVVAELNPSTGWDTWQTQQIAAPVNEATLTPETRAERARKISATKQAKNHAHELARRRKAAKISKAWRMGCYA